MSEAFEVEGLSLTIAGSPILREVGFRIGQGENWSILGTNGAGKSSLLRCLLRLQPGWTGSVRVLGRTLPHWPQRELARHVAYVPQAGGEMGFAYTVRELLRMARYAYSGPFGIARPGDQAAIDEALARAGVATLAERTVETLSGGERQKVLLAAALAQGAEVLLLDEPTAFLDYRHQAEVAAILKEVNQTCGTTVVTVTHDVNAAIAAGGQVLALRDGEVAWQGAVSQLTEGDRLERIYGARFRFLHDPVSGARLVAPQGLTA